ncbi:Acetyl-coenzyme A synthetase 2-like, mitochondrial [Aphelenchoides besseyi]|nr:Acetyl-coenzyme A synthetase 2-like, mitochondrial [Aphelenchoides besseyi]KAI6208820.1 Acetyl-coenzyme A synthetase 2-like, mitochondrial [Aphelenchoides besseyi]
MSDRKTKFTLDETVEFFEPPEALRAGAHVKDLPGYHQLYDRSVRDADNFWLETARELFFNEFSSRGLEYNFDVRKGPIYTRFLAGSKTNISYNCLERAIRNGNGNKIAYKWIGNEPGDEKTITYQELHDQVAVFATVLRSKGVCKGDVVAIYLPMILELPIAMLACARIGAPHSVIFAGFSAESLAQRIQQAKAQVLVTADAFCRGPKLIQLKVLADHAAEICEAAGHKLRSQVVVEHIQRVRLPSGVNVPPIQWTAIDSKFGEEMEKFADVQTPVEWMDAEDPLFVLYTSGSTGVPKGIVHTTAGYMTYAYLTTKLTFDAQPDDIFWCSADCGWITGHTYVVYGSLLNQLTSIFFEGIPTYPTAARTWSIVEEHKVTKLYTSPTAVRCLMGFPQEMVTSHDRSTLKIIGSVGEPINPSAWLWLYEVVGKKGAAIVDTYWQTETGGHVITPLPVMPTKPGSAALPFLGVRAVLVDKDGAVIEGPGEGNLCFTAAWPGISRTVLGDHDRFEKTYFKSFPGLYFTGDGARRDEDGYYWITGRVDDLMNVSGHLLSTAEIESALTAHSDVVEAAVVAAEHSIKGHFPYAFVVIHPGKQLTNSIVNELKLLVREKIGPIAVPDEIQLAPGLPKTRSGKITRRILRKIAEGDQNADLGDVSTLIDSAVIDQLWARVPTRTG